MFPVSSPERQPDPPVVYRYQRALDAFRREGREPPLLKRMSELISLLDLTTTLSTDLPGTEILEAALLIVLGELRATRGALLVRREGDRYALTASRGLAPDPPREVVAAEVGTSVIRRGSGPPSELLDHLGLELLCPVRKGGRAIALLGIGPPADGGRYSEEDADFLRSVAACAATPIENGMIHEELQRLNRRLSVKVFQLRNLFDVSRELTTSLEEEAIANLVVTTLMGYLMVSRCALFLAGPEGLVLAHERGLRAGERWPSLGSDETRKLLASLSGPTPVEDLAPGVLRERLEASRLSLVVPLPTGRTVAGLLAAGERRPGTPLGEEDRDFAATLARQAQAALESVRLHRIRLEKQRQDRDLEIAREIQRSLFPQQTPALAGFEVAAESRSCFQVGGDLYDFIPLGPERLGLVVADISGKGTPASILMASVHASLRALAGSVDPAPLMERLNAFLMASTQASRYVTLFYGEIDGAARRLRYVTAGHIPPVRISRSGDVERLEHGGTVVGLLDEVRFETGEVELAPGDLVAVVTDGATEALSESGEEYGDARMVEAFRVSRSRAAPEIVHALLESVDAWTGPAGCGDDLTVLILKALEP